MTGKGLHCGLPIIISTKEDQMSKDQSTNKTQSLVQKPRSGGRWRESQSVPKTDVPVKRQLDSINLYHLIRIHLFDFTHFS